MEDRQWDVYVTQADETEKKYVYKRPAGELPPKVGYLVELDQLGNKATVLEIDPPSRSREPWASSERGLSESPPKLRPVASVPFQGSDRTRRELPMAKNIERPAVDQGEQTEYRSMTAAAIVATPFVLAAQPIIGAWAEQHFSHRPEDDPPPQEPQKKD